MDQSHNKNHHDPKQNLQREDDDVDALLASLEEEDDSAYRVQRMQELKDAPAATGTTATFDTLKKDYITLTSDDETLNFTTEHDRAVVHFFHPDFSRCNTMDDHCQVIADKHAEYGNADVSFARVDVKNCPFVVEKLGVRVLPCVIGFVKGVVKGRITGFEGLCWDGNERSMNVTKAVEETFVSWSVLRKRLLLGHSDDSGDDDEVNVRDRTSTRRGISGRKQQVEDEDDDWD